MAVTEVDADFRQEGIQAGRIALKNIMGIINGAPYDPQKARLNETVLRIGQKFEHMNQLREQSGVSNALRVASMLRDPEQRAKYIKALQPTIRTRLLAAPEKTHS